MMIYTGVKTLTAHGWDVKSVYWHPQKFLLVSALAWHPFHEELFVSRSHDSSIIHWLVGHEQPQPEVSNAHDSNILDLPWGSHGPLCSGCSNHTMKFWCRNCPGDNSRQVQRTSAVLASNEQMAPLGRASGSVQMELGELIPGCSRMAEWSKAADSSSAPLTRAWVQIPLLTFSLF
ncbi:hypothetical protein SELMODRAFT_422350 [Selaginella moellendorffii]|uniref:Uncharacterized protein n=1 Tax=Selaginella moellendorffii TaxID=88036 RepID=D8SI46_SELML|nr:hypothetical protein SELMODRAFT_422350 [Selaginella moellendorffii]